MGLPRVDTSVWNLGLPLALVGGCSRIFAIDDDGAASESTTVVAETTAPSTSVGPDPTLGDTTTVSPTTIDPSQTDPTVGTCASFGDCLPGECCIGMQCVPVCGPECPPELCCYGMCGSYGCYSDDECGGGAVCSYGACLPIDLEPECMLGMQLEFQIPIAVDGDIRALAFVDADGDAQHDVVIGEGTRVRLLIAADQSLADLQLGVEAASVVVGDLDADGDDDIVFGDRIADGPAVRALLHDPMVSFAPVWLADLPATSGLALADSDGDMIVDVLAIDELTGLQWLHGLGGATFEPPLSLFDGATSLAVGAIDGDEFTDVVVHQGFEWAFVGGSMFAPYQLLEDDYGAPTRVVAVGDFDGTGVDDVVALQSSVGTTIVTSWQGSAFDFVEHQSWWWGATTVLARADVDDDGYDDVVTAGGESQFVVGHGAPPMATSDVLDCVLTVPTQLPVLQLAVGDFTGDGRLDVVTSDGSTLDVYVQTS